MPTADEKAAFSERLKRALKRTPRAVTTATELALQFNLRHPAGPITAQAAQKWLSGQSVPTVDKIATLSSWLGVSIKWLRFGLPEEQGNVGRGGNAGRALDAAISPTPEEALFIAKLRGLPERQRALVLEMADQLFLVQEIRRE